MLLAGCLGSSEKPLPYANLSPVVGYTGSKACAPCHREIFDAYLRSEMGRSMAVLDSANIIETFPQRRPVHDPGKNFSYEMVRRDGKYYQREFRTGPDGSVIHERYVEAQYVMGSGNNLRMYFNDQGGMLYELPLTWYVHRGEWDLSPGYRDHENLRFSRFAGGTCIACHNSFLRENPDAADHFVPPYDLGIGCERCHGPGELHVRQALEHPEEPEEHSLPTIVNPAKLPPTEQMDVCQQCHLMGKAWVLRTMDDWFGYRPGLPLETHRSVYVPQQVHEQIIEVGDSPQRLSLSRCFRESNGALTCITCHDPHYSIKTFTAAHYNGRCLSCHSLDSLSARRLAPPHTSPDGCVSCHMNRTGSDNTLHGVSNTDHWIRTNARATQIDWSLLRLPPDRKETVALIPFLDRPDEGSSVRRGMAYLYYFREHDNRPRYLDSTLRYLEPAIHAGPRDMQSYYTLGEAYHELGRHRDAVRMFTDALAVAPEDDRVMYALARDYALAGAADSAGLYFDAALRRKPGDPVYLEGVATHLAKAGAYGQALEVFDRAIAIDSTNYLAHFYAGNLLGRYLGKPLEAIAHYEAAVRLEPDAAETHTNLGNTLMMIGETDRALAEYRIQTGKWPGSYEAWVNMGKLYASIGKKEEAKQSLAKALQLRPDRPEAFEALEQMGGRESKPSR